MKEPENNYSEQKKLTLIKAYKNDPDHINSHSIEDPDGDPDEELQAAYWRFVDFKLRLGTIKPLRELTSQEQDLIDAVFKDDHKITHQLDKYNS